MSTDALKVEPSKLLVEMGRDAYYPTVMVDKVRDVLLDACREIEAQRPADLQSLYEITCRATERINDLEEDFAEYDSEIETVAREDIAVSFAYIAEVYGFSDADIEALIATRDW